MKQLFILFLGIIYIPTALYSQTFRDISPSPEEPSALNLSQIAKSVTPIVLDKSLPSIRNIFLTEEYLFVIQHSDLFQFDRSGTYIRTTLLNYQANEIAIDQMKKVFYVSKDKVIECYDFSGNLKNTINPKYSVIACCFHEGLLWVLSYNIPEPFEHVDYFVSSINPIDKKEVFLPFNEKSLPIYVDDTYGFAISRVLFSIYKNTLTLSLEDNEYLFHIKKDQIVPILKISDAVFCKNQKQIRDNLLYIKYKDDRNGLWKNYLFIQNLETDEIYHTEYDTDTDKQIKDDIFNTGSINLRALNPFDNKTGEFFFEKERKELTGDMINDVPLKSGNVLFIVKTK